MSNNLYWKPFQNKGKDLDTSLKFALRARYGFPINGQFNEANIEFLTGLKIAGVKDAEKLIEAIEKYHVVELWEEG